MGFVMGSSCFLHSPIHHSCFPLSSSSSSAPSVLLYSCVRKVEISQNKNRAAIVASLSNEGSNSGDYCKRRAALFLGAAVLPLLQLKARATEGLLKDERNLSTFVEKQKEYQRELQNDESANPLSLLNGLGVFGTGVLGAFYALAKQEKEVTEASLESMKIKLKEKEADNEVMKKNYEIKLVNEKEESTKELKKAKEAQQILTNQLTSANDTIKKLGQELLGEKKLIENLKIQIDSLESDLSKTREEKNAIEENLKEKLDLIEVLQERINLLSLEIFEKENEIQNLSSSLAQKESEINDLNAVYVQTKNVLAKVNSEFKDLNESFVRNSEELDSKNAAIDDLNGRINVLIVEKDDSNKRIDEIKKEYDDLKITFEKKAALDSKILGEKDNELRQLKEKLESSLNEETKNQNLIVGITQERDNLKNLLDSGLNNVKNLKADLRAVQETLEASKNEASDLKNELKNSKKLCTELETELFRVGAEFSEAKNVLQKNLGESKKSSELLSSEVKMVKSRLIKTEEDLQEISHKFSAAKENNDILQKELVEVYKKAENAANDLKEEKKMVANLSKELKSLEIQILNDKEARKSLETDLEEATKSLDEMNRNALLLSRELEIANTRISELEDEKEVIYNSLLEQKNVSQAARENMEDAHNLVMRLGKERESLEKKGRKFEQELASAKGEILRLRSKINSPKSIVDDPPPPPPHQEKDEEEEENVAVSAVKKTRRRKTIPPS